MAKNRIINIVYKVNKKEIDAATASTKKIQGETQKLQKNFKDTESVGTKAFKAIGAAVAAIGFASLVKNILQLGAAQQQLNIAFTTFLGDANKAKKLIAELTKFSIITPFTPEQVNKAAKSLLAFGVQAKDIIKTLKFLGDVSAGTGKDLSEMAIIFGQIRSTGRLMGQDLLQLINAGFNPLQIISEKTGKSVAELKKEMEKGLVTFKDVEDAFITATSAGGLFFNLMEKQSQSIAGKWSTIMGNIEEVSKGIFESNIEIIDLLVTKLGQYTDAFNEIISMANSDPIFESATRIVEAYTTSLDEAGESTDKVSEALEQIAKGKGGGAATALFIELRDAIKAYELQSSIAEKTVQTTTGEEFEKWNTILERNRLVIKMLRETSSKLQKDAVSANLKHDLQQQGLEEDLARSAVEEKLTINLDYYKTRDDLQKKWEKFYQDQIKDSNELQSDRLKEQEDWEFNQRAIANDREVKEIDEQNKRKRELEEQHQEEMRQLKQQAFNYGIDLLGQALFASIDANQLETQAIQEGYDRRIDAAGDNQRKVNELRIEADEAARESAKKQAEFDQKKQIKVMIIQNLLNALRALGTPPVPNWPLAGLTAGYGLASIGVAKAIGFKEGVIDLQGPGTSTSDSIPARLSKHESVMTAKETGSSKGLLEMIRARKLDDKIFDKIQKKGIAVPIFNDGRIVSAIERNKVDLSRQGATLYEWHQVSRNLRRKVRSKIIAR